MKQTKTYENRRKRMKAKIKRELKKWTKKNMNLG
jgi:hypothetical protein